jgi:hypothetical protein
VRAPEDPRHGEKFRGWVLAKFVITLVQLYAGIFLLSPALNATVAAPGHVPSPAMLLGTRPWPAHAPQAAAARA